MFASIWNWIMMYLDWFYWVPLVVCAIGVPFILLRQFRKDVDARDRYDQWLLLPIDPITKQRAGNGSSYFDPRFTIGYIMARVLLSLIPIANLFYATFHVMPFLLFDFVKLFEGWFNVPLVRSKQENKQPPSI